MGCGMPFIAFPSAFPPIDKKVRQAVGRKKITCGRWRGKKKIVVAIQIVFRQIRNAVQIGLDHMAVEGGQVLGGNDCRVIHQNKVRMHP